MIATLLSLELENDRRRACRGGYQAENEEEEEEGEGRRRRRLDGELRGEGDELASRRATELEDRT